MEHYLGLFEPDRDAGGYVVTFPDFGYGATQRETVEEAMDMARDLLMLTIDDCIRGRPRLSCIEKALAVLGKRLHIEVRDAA